MTRSSTQVRTPTTTRDACPLCRADLGPTRGATRRRIVFSATPGQFRWQCPDCRGIWTQPSPGQSA